MPVKDNPPTEGVKREAGYRASCHNREGFSQGYWANDRDKNWNRITTWIPHVMSKTCRQINELAECKECQADKDTQYIEEERARK